MLCLVWALAAVRVFFTKGVTMEINIEPLLLSAATAVWIVASSTSESGCRRFQWLAVPQLLARGVMVGILAAVVSAANASVADDQKTVAALDTQYQAAVKKNDAATMDRLLADDFVLVTGSGKTYGKADLLHEARGGQVLYEHQEDRDQTVRVWGDVAVVTAKLWEKGTNNGKPFDRTVWFSDTYVRTPGGWRYVFGQSSLPLPKASSD
jgi:ketosteroid isomerase-like protein